MAATAQQAFVPPQGYEQKDVASNARTNVTQAEYTTTSLPLHGVVVTASTIPNTASSHPTLPQTAVTLVQAHPIQHTQGLQQTGTTQIIATSVLSPEELQATTGKEGKIDLPF